MSGQIIATSHDLTPNCSWEREMGPLISGKSWLVKHYSIWPDLDIHLVWPPPSNSHHQDYYIFRIGDPYKPSFATVTGRGPHMLTFVSTNNDSPSWSSLSPSSPTQPRLSRPGGIIDLRKNRGQNMLKQIGWVGNLRKNIGSWRMSKKQT